MLRFFPQSSARWSIAAVLALLGLLAGLILGLHAIVWFFTSSAWMMA